MRELGPRGADARRFGVGVVVTGGVRRGVFGVWRSFGGAINSFQLSLDTDPVNYNNNHNKHNNTAPGLRRLYHRCSPSACRCQLIGACLIGKQLTASKPRDDQDTSKQHPRQRHRSCSPPANILFLLLLPVSIHLSLHTPGRRLQLNNMAGHARGMSATFIPGGPSDDYYQPAPLELIAPEPQR